MDNVPITCITNGLGKKLVEGFAFGEAVPRFAIVRFRAESAPRREPVTLTELSTVVPRFLCSFFCNVPVYSLIFVDARQHLYLCIEG